MPGGGIGKPGGKFQIDPGGGSTPEAGGKKFGGGIGAEPSVRSLSSLLRWSTVELPTRHEVPKWVH